MKFIVRSTVNKNSILATDGQFHAECFFGPGNHFSAKIYKTRKGAENSKGKYGTAEEAPDA